MELPPAVNVLVVGRMNDAGLARIKAVAPERLNVQVAAEDFLGEPMWPETSGRGRGMRRGESTRTPAESEALLRRAHVLYVGFPFPKNLAPRAESAVWAHFIFAGVSNLKGSSWWQSPFLVTSTRGQNQARPIAETMMGVTFLFAKRLDAAVRQSDAQSFEGGGFGGMKLIEGKTMGIIGLGGIGSQLATLARGCGMRVVATRRSATQRRNDVDGVDVLYPPSELHSMLSEADYVAVCAMWTDETERLMNEAAFAAMKPGSYLLNTARGEIVDEAALVAALRSGHLAGAYLDVWDDDFEKPPSPELTQAPNVLFTPHVSGRADVSQGFSLEVFCDNLGRLLRGEALVNVVDWERGY